MIVVIHGCKSLLASKFDRVSHANFVQCFPLVKEMPRGYEAFHAWAGIVGYQFLLFPANLKPNHFAHMSTCKC